MALNKGKAFEDRVKDQWMEAFPKKFFIRLYDTTNGYININNPCDFIGEVDGKVFLIECKSHKGSSISFSSIPQYERLLQYKHCDNTYPGILLWLIEKDKIVWIPIETAEQIYKSGSKSIGLRHIEDPAYKVYEIPSKKLRVFMYTDYTAFRDIERPIYKEDGTYETKLDSSIR